MFSWAEFFRSTNAKQAYHSQRQNKATETVERLFELGLIVEIGSTSKALDVGYADFDYLLIFPVKPYEWNRKSIVTDEIISGFENHDKYFRAIKKVLKSGVKESPAFVYKPVAPIQGTANGIQIQVEIVPAIRIIRNGQLSNFLLIPGERSCSWKVTDALMEAHRLVELNSLFPKFKDFVRFWKALVIDKGISSLTSRQIVSLMGSWTASNLYDFPTSNLECLKSQVSFIQESIRINSYSDFSGERKKEFKGVWAIREIREILSPILKSFREQAKNLEDVLKILKWF